VGGAQLGQRDGQGHRPVVGVLVLGGRSQAGEVLGGSRHAGLLLGGDERLAAFGDHGGVVAVGALVLVDEVARLVVDVQHGREIDVHAHACQVLPAPVPAAAAAAAGSEDWPI